jgi:hypothetical protein
MPGSPSCLPRRIITSSTPHVGVHRHAVPRHTHAKGRVKEMPPMKKANSAKNNPEKVNEFMDKLDHPFKAEVQAVREIIKSVNEQITEEIKWKAPSFSYKGYMATFNLWAKEHVHLIFHNGAVLHDQSGLLQGDTVDRCMVYFSDMEDAGEEWMKLKESK